MWQYEVGASSRRATTYHDFVTKLVAFMTSQGVDTVAINAAGTGYVVGDILELPHAGGYLLARFEVTSVGGGGDITGLRIVANGAYGDRAASAVVSAGGANYAVGNILEVQGGTAREKAKFQVATLAGSAVATVTLFESGGVYSAAPANPASTTKIGPTAGTGTGCTLTVTYTGLIGTTGLATTTTGAGTGATVDITLAQTGWSVDNRNTNSTTFNGVTNEKEVVLKGDAAGRTNKPYFGIATFTRTSGVNTRYIVAFHGLIAHNQAIALSAQPNIYGNPGTWSDERPYLLCDENQLQSMDFWLSVNDYRVAGVLDTNSGAATSDDRQFHSFYQGFYDTYATEAEDPYPFLSHAASRASNVDPSLSSTNITSISELTAPPAPGTFNTGTAFYRAETAEWVAMNNNRSSAASEMPHVIWPLCNLNAITSPTNSNDQIGFNAPVAWHSSLGQLDRSSASRRLFPIPGTTPLHYPFPLIIISTNAGTQSSTVDVIKGAVAGCFLIYNTNSAGATITNFALDYITVGSDRFRVFHTHVQRQLYHYWCLKEDV